MKLYYSIWPRDSTTLIFQGVLSLSLQLPTNKFSPHSVASNCIHDFRHSKAWITSMPRRFLWSVVDIFAPENRRSGSTVIAGIDTILRAIGLRLVDKGQVYLAADIVVAAVDLNTGNYRPKKWARRICSKIHHNINSAWQTLQQWTSCFPAISKTSIFSASLLTRGAQITKLMIQVRVAK